MPSPVPTTTRMLRCVPGTARALLWQAQTRPKKMCTFQHSSGAFPVPNNTHAPALTWRSSSLSLALKGANRPKYAGALQRFSGASAEPNNTHVPPLTWRIHWTTTRVRSSALIWSISCAQQHRCSSTYLAQLEPQPRFEGRKQEEVVRSRRYPCDDEQGDLSRSWSGWNQ